MASLLVAQMIPPCPDVPGPLAGVVAPAGAPATVVPEQTGGRPSPEGIDPALAMSPQQYRDQLQTMAAYQAATVEAVRIQQEQLLQGIRASLAALAAVGGQAPPEGLMAMPGQ